MNVRKMLRMIKSVTFLVPAVNSKSFMCRKRSGILEEMFGFHLSSNYNVKSPFRCWDLRTEGNIYLLDGISCTKWHKPETCIYFKDTAYNLLSCNYW